MKSKVATLLVAVATALGGAPVALSGSATASSTRETLAPATVELPRQVVEGDRYLVRITVARPRRAKRVILQHWVTDVLGNGEWAVKRRFLPQRKLLARAVAGVEDRERYRVRVVPKRGRTVTTPATSVTVWHWYPLTSFDAYYETSGVINSSLSSFPMNGQQYKGWRTYGSYGSWESRFTPGRHCSTFRGDFGVQDDSSDLSSAEITVTTDDDRIAYASPSLPPGAVDSPTIDLRRTYRFSIAATDTSVDPAYAFPAIGDAELLCTGFEN